MYKVKGPNLVPKSGVIRKPTDVAHRMYTQITMNVFVQSSKLRRYFGCVPGTIAQIALQQSLGDPLSTGDQTIDSRLLLKMYFGRGVETDLEMEFSASLYSSGRMTSRFLLSSIVMTICSILRERRMSSSLLSLT